jgi:hypothetical protein
MDAQLTIIIPADPLIPLNPENVTVCCHGIIRALLKMLGKVSICIPFGLMLVMLSVDRYSCFVKVIYRELGKLPLPPAHQRELF